MELLQAGVAHCVCSKGFIRHAGASGSNSITATVNSLMAGTHSESRASLKCSGSKE